MYLTLPYLTLVPLPSPTWVMRKLAGGAMLGVAVSDDHDGLAGYALCIDCGNNGFYMCSHHERALVAGPVPGPAAFHFGVPQKARKNSEIPRGVESVIITSTSASLSGTKAVQSFSTHMYLRRSNYCMQEESAWAAVTVHG